MTDEIMTPAEVAGIAARHQADPVYDRCFVCNGTRWPCDVAMLCASHVALHRRLPLMEAALAVLRAARRFERAISGDAIDEDDVVAVLAERASAYERYEAAEARETSAARQVREMG